MIRTRTDPGFRCWTARKRWRAQWAIGKRSVASTATEEVGICISVRSSRGLPIDAGQLRQPRDREKHIALPSPGKRLQATVSTPAYGTRDEMQPEREWRSTHGDC